MYKIVKAECLADKIYLMDVEAPRVARACQPGEFVIVKMDEAGERIPLTICDFDREKGLVTIVFQTVGASTERMAGFKAGDYIVKPESSDRWQIGPTGSLQGVYNINRGYTVFKQIEILDSNSEYYTVRRNMDYGLAVYDHIVLDASLVEEGQLLYQ